MPQERPAVVEDRVDDGVGRRLGDEHRHELALAHDAIINTVEDEIDVRGGALQ